jgi:hypothetical protein
MESHNPIPGGDPQLAEDEAARVANERRLSGSSQGWPSFPSRIPCLARR